MDRRDALGILVTGALGASTAWAQTQAPLRRALPRGDGTLPIIGMGTWLTFDVGEAIDERERRARVVDAFFAGGGGMIDSSPMYGRAERVVGDLLAQRARPGELIAATKVWTPFDARGAQQIEQSLRLWRLPRLDVVYVHNLLNWRAHLPTLRSFKERGLVRWIGVTTSHGARHAEMLDVIRREPLDFMQITYSVADTSAEPVIAAALDHGIAVVANRPFDGGALVDRANRLPLPGWAADIDCANWAQVLLKWIVSHPGIVCAIPATSDPTHMAQNMGAARGPLADAVLRRRIADHLQRWL